MQFYGGTTVGTRVAEIKPHINKLQRTTIKYVARECKHQAIHLPRGHDDTYTYRYSCYT